MDRKFVAGVNGILAESWRQTLAGTCSMYNGISFLVKKTHMNDSY